MTDEIKKPADDATTPDAGRTDAPSVKSGDTNDEQLTDEQLEGVAGGLKAISFD